LKVNNFYQINFAEVLAPLGSPIMADFVANLNRINQLAEASDCFIWRLQSPAGDAFGIRPFGPNEFVNMIVWRDLNTLKAHQHIEAKEGLVGAPHRADLRSLVNPRRTHPHPSK
jgi:hypothetical protein